MLYQQFVFYCVANPSAGPSRSVCKICVHAYDNESVFPRLAGISDEYRVFEGIMRHQNTFICNLGQKGEQNLKLGVNIS